jgi:hypothetical protein
MGHQLLGNLPDTVPWRRVVALVADDAEVSQVAQATTQAALQGLRQATNDPGLVHSVWLLTQIALAARQEAFVPALRSAGLSVPDQPEVFALAASFSQAVASRLHQKKRRTDLGELAKLAGVESLTSSLRARVRGLFGVTTSEVQQAARSLSTRAGFTDLAHDFFACFTRRFLTYHLSRELSLHVGGHGRFRTTDDHNVFLAELDHHSREAALIVRTYAGDWYDKHRFLNDLTIEQTRRFVNYALVKLERELLRRGARHGH